MENQAGDHLLLLRASLAEHFQRASYLRCESMGALIRENLESIRRRIGPAAPPALAVKLE